MSLPNAIPQQVIPVECLSPAADAAGRTGAYLSVVNCSKVSIVCHVNQGNAATIALTPYQATSIAGANEKVLANAVQIWADQDCASASTQVRQADATSFTTSTATTHKIVVFEVDVSQLDCTNNFAYLTLKTGASNASNITQATYFLRGNRL